MSQNQALTLWSYYNSPLIPKMHTFTQCTDTIDSVTLPTEFWIDSDCYILHKEHNICFGSRAPPHISKKCNFCKYPIGKEGYCSIGHNDKKCNWCGEFLEWDVCQWP